MANCNYKVNIKDIQSKYSFKIFCAGDNADVKAEIGNLEDLTTTAKNNLVSAINEVHSDTETNATAISGLQSGKEDKSNKVTSISSTSTDTQYPSAKAVYDSQETQNETISTLEDNLESTKEELDYYKTIYNVLPKVSDNGESITLNNTGESILKLDPRGQCKQDSTTGKNLFDYSKVSSVTNYLSLNNDVFTYANGAINSSYVYFNSMTLQANTTYSFDVFLVGSTQNTKDVIIVLRNTNGDELARISKKFDTNISLQYTPSSDVNIDRLQFYNVPENPMNGAINFKIQIEKSEAMTSYEPYTGGQPSPSPDFPQQIHEVSGDNTIEVVGKNILNPSIITSNFGLTYDNTTGYFTGAANNYGPKDLLELKTPEYLTFSYKGDTSTQGLYLNLVYADGTSGAYYPWSFTNEHTYTPIKKVSKVLVSSRDTSRNNNFRLMIELGQTATTFEPYNRDTYELSLGDIKMRGIGTYEDYFTKNTGKNLFDGTYVNAYTAAASPYTFSSSNSSRSGIVKVEPNTTYTISKETSNRFRIGEYSSQPEIGVSTATNFISTDEVTSYTITTGNTTNYLAIQVTNESQENVKMQVELGSQATIYEPFGKDMWCKYNAIGKYVYNNDMAPNGLFDDYTAFLTPILNIGALIDLNAFSNMSMCNMLPTKMDSNYTGFSGTTASKKIRVNLSTDIATTYEEGYTLFANKNLTICYAYEKPYLSPIENETLISQLDKVEKALGKDGQTNISQVNNDIPFKIYASALKEIE